MRSFALHSPSFAGGLALGLALSGVALVIARAARRHALDHVEPGRKIIDGARPIDPVKLTIGPAFESTSGRAARVEGELGDPPPNSQRW